MQDPGGGSGAGNSAAPGGNNEQMTPMGMGVIGGLASSNPSTAPECGDLAELSQADLKGLVGEMTEEDEIFTSISDPNFELDNIFAEVSFLLYFDILSNTTIIYIFKNFVCAE